MMNKIKNNQKNLFIITDIIILFLPIFYHWAQQLTLLH